MEIFFDVQESLPHVFMSQSSLSHFWLLFLKEEVN